MHTSTVRTATARPRAGRVVVRGFRIGRQLVNGRGDGWNVGQHGAATPNPTGQTAGAEFLAEPINVNAEASGGDWDGDGLPLRAVHARTVGPDVLD